MFFQPDRFVTDEYIAARIDIEKPYPDIVVAAGPCRSGTTFYLQVFAQSDFQAWSQPLKAVLRSCLHNHQPRFGINGDGSVFVKETLGPFLRDESLFNPVKIFLLVGVPEEKLHLLVLTRDPYATATSWIEQFSQFETRENLVDTCLLCYESIDETKQFAISAGVRTTTLAYDVWRDNDPTVIGERLFRRLERPFSPAIVSGWQPLPLLEAERKKIFSLPQPDFFNRNHASYYEKVNQSAGITYFSKPDDVICSYLSPIYLDRIARSRALQIHREFIRATEADLDIKIEPSPTLFYQASDSRADEMVQKRK
ncbi:MAG: hypothetical protein FJ010_04230 [Chloroflexi bacterium]|nr:hypothetical protein [Chloroflexota bacterium]